jgi:hypothetical protein
MINPVTFGILTSVFLTLCVYSFVYKESMFWRFAEQTFIGLAMGYTFVLAVQQIRTVAWIPLSTGKNYLLVIPLVLGLMLYARFSKNYAWMSRWPMAVLIGLGTGIAMRTVIEAQIVQQISATFLPLITPNPMTTINNIAIVVMVFCTLFFFTFTGGTGKTADTVRKLGRYTLMLTFGAAFGATVLTRMTLFIGRFTYLWAPNQRPYLLAIGAIMLLVLALYEKIPGLSQKK